MYLDLKLTCGKRLAIIVRHETEERLLENCFRGTSLALAGNFSLWNSAEELFGDSDVLKDFMDELDQVYSEHDFSTHGVCIDYASPVGWESTSPIDIYSDNDLEKFYLNRSRTSSGLRVKLSRTDLKAPPTEELTIVYEFKLEDDKVAAVIHSIYPGKDVGELKGDVTAREKRVFFDWGHPGQV